MSLMCTKPRMWSSEFFVHRNARALRGGEHPHRIFEARVGGERVHVGPRHHHLAHLDPVQLHRVLDEFHFGRGKQAAVARLLHHHLQFLDGAHQGVARKRLHAQRLQHLFGETVEQIDGPAESIQEPVKRPRHQQRDALGARQAQALRDQFAEHHLQNGEQSESESQRDAVSKHRRPGAVESRRPGA